VAWALTHIDVDGRSAHVAGVDIARYLLTSRQMVAWRAASPPTERIADVAMVRDERSTTYRRAVVRGPAVVLLRGAFTARQRGKTLRVGADRDSHLVSGQRVRLREGQRLEIECARR
jgi:hypothetical protein